VTLAPCVPIAVLVPFLTYCVLSPRPARVTSCSHFNSFGYKLAFSLSFSQPPLRTGDLTRTSKPLISQIYKPLPHIPSQGFKMALVVPSFNAPPHTRCSPPPPLTKEILSVGCALAPHRLAPRLLHPQILSSNLLVCVSL